MNVLTGLALRLGGFALLVIALGGWELPVTKARRVLKEQYIPAKLHQSPTGKEKSTSIRTIRVRVHADSACRAGLNPKARFRSLLKSVNEFVEPGFSVAFELHDLRKWAPKVSATQLEQMLEELKALDPGDDVDLVVGCTSPLQIETTSTHEAGRAALLGKHFVLRPLSDLDDERAFREGFYALDEAERSAALKARAAHKAVAFFVHEWAHTLGALHEREPSWLLHPQWTVKQGAFSYINTRVIEIALRHRTSASYDRAEEAREMLSFLKTFDEEWSPQERAWLMETLKSRATNSAPPQAGVDYKPLPPATALNDPRTWLDKVEALHAAGNVFEAQDAINKAHELALAEPNTPPHVWGRFAEVALQFGALSMGEDAVQKAGAAVSPKASRLFEVARRRVGLPKGDASVAAELEVIYSSRFWEVVKLLNEDKSKDADKALIKYATFSRTSGFQLLQCELALRRNDVRGARGRCGKALEQNPQLARAHVLLAAMDEAARKRDAAIAHLEAAIALDNDDKTAWNELARHYTKAHKQDKVANLRSKYLAAFGEPMMPGPTPR